MKAVVFYESADDLADGAMGIFTTRAAAEAGGAGR